MVLTVQDDRSLTLARKNFNCLAFSVLINERKYKYIFMSSQIYSAQQGLRVFYILGWSFDNDNELSCQNKLHLI